MNTRPRKPRRWGRWLAAAACALALAAPLHAQGPPDPDPTRHPVETQVKLAWLADPVTFPYALGAELTPQGLVVTGYVLSEPVRRRAMEVAQQHAGAAVLDRLTVYPNLFLRLPAAANAADLQTRAAELLAREFPELAPHLQVSADGKGRVRVAGVVPSAAEQLAVSQRLRRLDACACVSNELQVPVPVHGSALAPMAAPPAVASHRHQPMPVADPVVPVAGRQEESAAVGSLTAGEIRDLVVALCAGSARGVRVEEHSGRRLLVVVSVDSEETGMRLGPYIVEQLGQLPELNGSKLDLEMDVAQ